MPGEERRLQILREAMSLFSQRGFAAPLPRKLRKPPAFPRRWSSGTSPPSKISTPPSSTTRPAAGEMDPSQMVAEAIKRKDDRAVFEGLALLLWNITKRSGVSRLLLHSALEKHELAQMFLDKFVRRVYEFLGGYIRERQRDGALSTSIRRSWCALSSAWLFTTR